MAAGTAVLRLLERCDALRRPERFDKVLLDPPRTGADAAIPQLPLAGVRRIVYVSCHPATLARDASQEASP